MRPSARTVLVTGSTSGIGRAITERLLKDGHTVIGLGRDHTKFQPESVNYHPYTVDLADLDRVAEALAPILTTHAEISGVVSNAGQGHFGGMEEFSCAQIRSAIDLNLTSHAMIARLTLPLLKKHPNSDLILMGSGSAVRGGKHGALYCAAKFGLRGMAQSLRIESAKRGVRVALVNPGAVRTEFFSELKFRPAAEDDNAILPEDIADTVAFILGSRAKTVWDEVNLSPLKPVWDFRE